MFRVGQKVVCVEGHYNPPASGGVVSGRVYTIRAIGLTVIGSPGIKLEETIFSCGPREIGIHTQLPFRDAFYRASRFRPVVERKTDISLFTDMLIPSDEKIGASA